MSDHPAGTSRYIGPPRISFKEMLKVMRPKARDDVPFDIQCYLVDYAESMLSHLEWMGSKKYIPEYAFRAQNARVNAVMSVVDKYKLISHIGVHKRVNKRRVTKECIDPGDAADATGLKCETCGRPLYRYVGGTTCVLRCSEWKVG